MPNTTVLPPLLAELERLGAGPDRVELLCATGTHRPAAAEELAALVGPDVMGRYRVHQHVADDGDHVSVGAVGGTPVLIDRRYVEADVRILTGFVEPHFFAGWSGGPKAACPGLAATSTILEAHSPARIADERATWMVTEGNPVHDFVRAATALCPPSSPSTSPSTAAAASPGCSAVCCPRPTSPPVRSPPARDVRSTAPSTWC